MMSLRKASTLGCAHSGGIAIRSYFSFSDYADPRYVHDGRLRVVNHLELAAGERYSLDQEENIDILTWVVSGDVEAGMDKTSPLTVHKGDLHVVNTGNGCRQLVWQAGEKGASFFQMWLVPDCENADPQHAVRSGAAQDDEGTFVILASGFPEDDPETSDAIDDGAPATLQTRARLLQATLPAGEGAAYETQAGRDLYLLLVDGIAQVGGQELHPGDALAMRDVERFIVMAQETSRLLLIDGPVA